MVKQPAMETSEFTMSHEDFPALPGAPPAGAGAVNSGKHILLLFFPSDLGQLVIANYQLH